MLTQNLYSFIPQKLLNHRIIFLEFVNVKKIQQIRMYNFLPINSPKKPNISNSTLTYMIFM